MDLPVITVGRLPENEIPIANISISRRHIRIEKDPNNQHVLTDLNSLNGTFVNNKKVTVAKLASGDKISVGNYSILFEIVPGDIAAGEPAPQKEAVKYTSVDKTNTYEMNQIGTEDDEDIKELQEHKAKDATLNSAVLIETNKHVIYKLDKPVMTIGSSESDDIFVEGFFISDEHVIIEKEESGAWISANKFMGRFKINGKKESRHKLQHKDRIEIGTSTFRYMEHGQKI
jgi:pSer/pThr/pTyr-binding forkhead associated (FHA) protein